MVWENRQIISCKLLSLFLCSITRGFFWCFLFLFGFFGLVCLCLFLCFVCFCFGLVVCLVFGFVCFCWVLGVFFLINMQAREFLGKMCLCYSFRVFLLLQSWNYFLWLKLVHRDLQVMVSVMESDWCCLHLHVPLLVFECQDET